MIHKPLFTSMFELFRMDILLCQHFLNQSRLVLCSDIHSSTSLVKSNTPSALTKCADFQMSVLFQIEYDVVHFPEITIVTAVAARHPP